MKYKEGMKVFSDWTITRLIGKGANGQVFELENRNFNVITKSALKVIRINKSEEEVKAAIAEGMDEVSITEYFKDRINRIVNEIAIMSELKSHSNIVSYEDHCVIENKESKYWEILIRMELLTSLSDYLTTRKMEEKEVIKLGYDLCNALKFCEKKGLIHRDIKPDNIFVNEEGVFKLGDFGIARSLESPIADMSKTGTENYMAPEIYLGQAYGANVDIYSLGIVLYRLMNNNRLPFYPPAPAQIHYEDRANAFLRRMQRHERIPAPDCASEEFSKIILKACSYYPNDRYKNAEEMLVELRKILLIKESELLDKTVYLFNHVDPSEEETVYLNKQMDSEEKETVHLNGQTEYNVRSEKSELKKAWDDYKNQNYNSAILVFKKHAEEGDSEAQLILSDLYKEGHGVKQDDETSEFWLKKSVDNGNTSAKFTYGMRLIATSGNDIKKLEKGLSYLEEVADKNDKNAMRNYIETIMKGHADKRTANKAISYCEYLINSSMDLYEKEKYNEYLNKLNKVLANAKFQFTKKVITNVFAIVGAVVLVIGALYVFCDGNPELWKENGLLKLLPKVTAGMLLPINALWDYLAKFISVNGMFGVQLVFISNILLTIGNVKDKMKVTEIINMIVRYLCFAIALLYLILGIKNKLITGFVDGENYILLIGVYVISLLAAYGIGVLIGNVIKKVGSIFDKLFRKE